MAGVALFVGVFAAIHLAAASAEKPADAIDIWIRAFGTCAFLMLTVILCIGPLARLNRRFLPLLYNRRHFGVLTFLVALTHAWLMIQWFIAQGNLPDLAAS